MLTAAEWLLLKSLITVCFAQAAAGIVALWRITTRSAVDHYRLGQIETSQNGLGQKLDTILTNHLPHLQNTLTDIAGRVSEIEKEIRNGNGSH